MNIKLLYLFTFINKQYTKLQLIVMMVCCLLFSSFAESQCIGPYQYFESCKRAAASPFSSLMTADNWVFSSAGTTVVNTITNARSGTNYVVIPVGSSLTTPVIASPNAFLFYARGANATTANFKVDWSTDNFVTSTTLSGLNTGGTTTYSPISLSTFGGATNVKIKVTNVSGGAMYVDDFSWTSTDPTQNTIVVPELGTTICNAIPWTVVAGTPIASYSLYDNGGLSDTYSKSQNHTLSFQSYNTSTKKVRVTINSLALAVGDLLSIYSGTADVSGNPTGTTLLNPSNTLTTPTSFISCSADGSITVKFTSTTSVPTAGFSIIVDCVDTAAPATLIAINPSTTPQSVCVGTTTTPLTVTVLGTVLTPTYQWYSNTGNSNSGGTLISSATSSSYTPPSAIANVGTTYYYCIVNNACDTQTSTVSGGITVNAIPADVTVSTSGTYCDSTTLTAANGGSGTIYWQNTTSGGTSTSTPSTSQLVTTSGTYYFRAQNAGCWGNEGSANVTINTAPTAAVAIAGSSATTTSIVANWNSVSGATGYFIDVSTSNTFASFVAGYNNLSVGNVTTYSVTGLTIGTTYYYRIRATNSCGTSVSSNTITYATLSSSYCTSSSTSSTAYLSNFDTTGGLTNISNNSSGYSASGYGNFTATQIVTQIQNGLISFTTSISGVGGGVGVSIFVDWNQNGVFTDTGEMVYTTGGFVFSNPSGTFTVPAAALSGTTRMRVVVDYFSSTPVSCNSGITGETEDYTFVVTSLACAGNPSSIAAVIVSTTATNISWIAATPAPANGYDYYLSTSAIAPSYGTTPTGSTGAGVTSISLTGLTTSTTYYIWVRANCGGGLGQGAWIGAISFFQPNCAVGNGNGTTTLGCPSVTAGGLGLNGAPPPPITGCSGSGCASLEATYLAMGQTTSYTVQSIPYAPPYQFTCLQNPVSVSVDDVWSPMINLPFNFCFYGNNYNKCLISSNGLITFDTVNNTPGGYSEWSYASNLPSTSLFLNSIFGVYHDIDPSKGGQIGWELITLNTGCRALVASWSDVPMFSTACNSILYTGMIVLYENTNIIDVYIKNKSVCPTWNDGNATVGIQDGTGTQAAVAPNRNGLDPNWTVTNEAWRFMPSGSSIASVKWYQGTGTTGTVVGTTDVISVCPATTTSYTAEVSYAMCSGTFLKEVSTTTVTVSGSKVWNGSIDTDWNKPNNWTPVGIPNATDCVIIPITANNPIVSQIVIGTPYAALAGTLSVLNGATLTITSVNTISVTDWVKVEPTGNFIIEDSSSLIQVTNVTNNVNIGNITYKRNASMRKLDYVYWSSPVAGFNVNNIASPLTAGAIYRWNTTVANTNGGWGNWESAAGNIMTPAKGYIASGPSSFSTTVNTTLNGVFNGVPNNGVITIPIYRGIDQNTAYHVGNNGIQITNFSDNWNLLGNPYPSSIRGSQFLLDNSTKLEGQIRLWTHGTLPALIPSPFYGTYMYNYTPQDYYTYNFTGTTCCPTADVDLFIGAGQGFFVTMKDGAAGSDTATFNNTLRNNTYNNTIFYKSGNATVNSSSNNVNDLERNRIWLDIIDPNNQTDRTLVGYVEGATMGRDSFFDAGTITTGTLAIYSLINKEKYSIQGRSLPFNPNDIVPVGVSVPVQGNYTIAIGAVDGLFENVSREIYLEDTLTGIIQNLRQGPYQVNLLAGTFSDRFKLRYKYPRGHGNNKTTTSIISDDVIATSSNGQLIVKSSYEDLQEITVYDTLGRQLLEVKNIENKSFISSNVSTTQQTLIVKIKLEDDTLVERKVVM